MPVQTLAPVALDLVGFTPTRVMLPGGSAQKLGEMIISNLSGAAVDVQIGPDTHSLNPLTANKYLMPGSVMQVTLTPQPLGLAGSQLTPPVAQGVANITFNLLGDPPLPGTYPALVGTIVATEVQMQSVSDPRDFAPVIDHRRYQLTAQQFNQYYSTQEGRVLRRDPLNITNPQWQLVTGTMALDGAVYLEGGQSLKLTTPAVAGQQALIRQFNQLAADQAFSTFPKLVAEFWFHPDDNLWRDVQLFIRPDDTQAKWQAAIRFLNQNAGVGVAAVQYLDSTGTFQTISTYNIRAPGVGAGDAWHHLIIAMNYLQGTGGKFTYDLIKFDDLTFRPAAGTVISAQSITPSVPPVREVSVDILITADGAAASVGHIAAYGLFDLSSEFQF